MDKRWRKIIVHVDMDAFFASVEQLLHPEWRGKPVIVGADPQGGKGRGVVSAASYEARRFGVHSAMPVSRAFRLCPQGIFVSPHGKLYQEYSRKIFAILQNFSPLIEPLSIDEAFLDMTGNLHLFGSVEEIGREIKRRIKAETGLTASVGIAPVKSVAKIASDFDKPDGLTVVPPQNVEAFLDALPVTRLWGVGEKTFKQLKKLGITTVHQLRQFPLEVLEQKFGKMGEHIYRMARGEDSRGVVMEEEVKSVSNERTFPTDQTDFEVIKNTVFQLAEKVGGRLRRSGLRGRTVQLKIRFQDFRTFTRSLTLSQPTYLTEEIFQAARQMLEEFDPLPAPVRLLGVGVSNLTSENGLQLSFWEAEKQKKVKMEKVMDTIQDRFGKDIIKHARALPAKKKPGNSSE